MESRSQMASMNLKQMKHWEKTISKGKLRFILIDGLLTWGFCVGILIKIIVNWFEGKPNSILDLVIRFIMFSILGCLFALRMWKKQERKYLEFHGVGKAYVDK
jgi:uncharacterized protein YacL